MQVIITVKRITEYSSIVEMTEEKYAALQSAWNNGDRETRRAAEKELNGLIDEKDWQDDEFESLDQFEPLQPQI